LKALAQRLNKLRERSVMAAKASYHQEAPAALDARNAATKSDSASIRTDASKLWPPSITPRTPIVVPTKRVDANVQRRGGSVEAESPVVLERFVRSLPARAVEEFTATVHPMVTRACATAGCHAPGNDTQFTLLRLPQSRTASRRLTQRNLYNTVQLVDFDRPEKSRLLEVASKPHGPLKAGVFGDQRSPKYRELAAWVSQLSGNRLNNDAPGNHQGPTGIAWDRLERSVELSRAAEQAKLEAVLDQFEPNRPAEIKPPTQHPATAEKPESARRGGQPSSSQKRGQPK
jgi:hypothetical protein